MAKPCIIDRYSQFLGTSTLVLGCGFAFVSFLVQYLSLDELSSISSFNTTALYFLWKPGSCFVKLSHESLDIFKELKVGVKVGYGLVDQESIKSC